MAKLTNHLSRTRLTTSSTGKHYSLDFEDDFRSGCRNVSHQQQFFSDISDHTIRTTDTPGFKPFTICRLEMFVWSGLKNTAVSVQASNSLDKPRA